jgi:hypothetical protein
MMNPSKILVGVSDIFSPIDDQMPIEDFKWQVQGANRADFLIKKILERNKTLRLIVKKVKISCLGDLVVKFNNHVELM